jgi:cell division protein FtsL
LFLVGSPGSFLKKLIAEQNIKNDRLTRGALLLLVFLVSLLLIAKVIMANRLVEASGKLRDLDKKIANLSATNGELSESVRTASSLTQLEDAALQSGFIKGQKFAVIKTTGSVALRLPASATNDSNQ